MARKPESENDILNGNRFVNNPNETTGVLHRDVDKLLIQYSNLRKKVYKTYKDYLPDQTTKLELKSYIDEQFIRLVKEFDINGEVDFPGYIKTKLNYRVKNSFIRGEQRDRQRVFVTRKDTDVSVLIDQSPMEDEELDYYEVLSHILAGVTLTDLEKNALFYILQEHSDTKIKEKLIEEFPNEKKLHIKEAISNMQSFLKEKLHESANE